MNQVKSGIWISKENPTIRIAIERVYKKKDYVDFFYFMCELMGGGRISKDELIEKYTYDGK